MLTEFADNEVAPPAAIIEAAVFAFLAAGFTLKATGGELRGHDRHGPVAVSLSRRPMGTNVRLRLSVPLHRMGAPGLDAFHGVTASGAPVVAYAANHEYATYDFEWFHPKGSGWGSTAQRAKECRGRIAPFLKAA